MNKQETEQRYKAKQDWLDKVMASKLTHAQARFAYCVFKHMYGTKIESWPTTEDIMEAGGFASSGHFKDFRDALIASGCLIAVLGYHTKNAKQKNYKYTLNLDWDGAVAPQGIAVAPQGISGSTSGDCRSTSGASNTTSNTTTKTTSKTSKSASAPVDSSLKEEVPNNILSQSPSFEEIVTPLLQESPFSLTETGSARVVHYAVKEKEMAHARQRAVLEDMYEDPDATW